jgi:hypothetical protein
MARDPHDPFIAVYTIPEEGCTDRRPGGDGRVALSLTRGDQLEQMALHRVRAGSGAYGEWSADTRLSRRKRSGCWSGRWKLNACCWLSRFSAEGHPWEGPTSARSWQKALGSPGSSRCGAIPTKRSSAAMVRPVPKHDLQCLDNPSIHPCLTVLVPQSGSSTGKIGGPPGAPNSWLKAPRPVWGSQAPCSRIHPPADHPIGKRSQEGSGSPIALLVGGHASSPLPA